MPVPIEMVPVWLVLNGIGHAVAEHGGGSFTYLACRSVVAADDVTKKRPKRICRECRKALKHPGINLKITKGR